MKSYLVVAVLAALGLTACSSEEKPNPVAPFNEYGIDDGKGADDSFAADGAPPKTEQVTEEESLEEDADDFLNEPAKKEDVLADAEVKEDEDLFAEEPTPPAEESAQIPDFDDTAEKPPADAPLAEAPPAETTPADAPPAESPATPSDSDLGPRYANEPPATAEDDLFAEPPKEEGGEAIPPFAGDAPAAEPVAETPPAEAPPADEPPAQNPPAAPPLDDLFGDAPPAAEEAPADANAAANAESSAAMQEFLEAMRAGDLDAAYEFVATPREPERQDLVRKQIAKMAELMIEGKLEIEPVHTRAQNKWALLVAHVKVDQNGQPVEKISEQFMVLHDGKWKVAPDTVRADPAVKELLDSDFDALMSWYQEHKTELQKQHAPAAPAS